MANTHLILVRHGETRANVDGRMQGRGDDPLTERGHQQVAQIARRLAALAPPPAALYSSSLKRAQVTSAAIAAALGLEPVLLDELQELHLGDLEGATAAVLDAHNRAFTGLDDRYPGGESIAEFIERITGVCRRIAAAHPGERVVAVSHGGVIATLLALWSGDGSRWREFQVDNCSYSEVMLAPQPRVLAVGDCSHFSA